jgi:acylphosphatase
VSGVVQGVFFRASTSDKAKELGVRGTVRNEPDGSVRIEAEGTDEALERFLDWCRVGPPAAVVENLEVTEGVVRGLDDFRVTF